MSHDKMESKYAEQYSRLLAINARVSAELMLADAAKNIVRSEKDYEAMVQVQVAREIAKNSFLDIPFEGRPCGESLTASGHV